MCTGFPESALGWEAEVSSRACSGGPSGLMMSCPCLESVTCDLLWWEGADRLPGCWSEDVQGDSIVFLISKVIVFCLVYLATN